MSTLPKTKLALRKNMRREATSLPVAMEAATKTRTRQLALRAISGDFDELDLENLDALGRIKGQLKNEYVESLSAAKITSATMLGAFLTLAGTDATNNKSRLAMTGDALLQIDPADEAAVPANMAGRGIFNTDAHFAGMWFYENAQRRGIQLRSDGQGGGTQGRITLIATKHPAAASTDTTAYAHAHVDAVEMPFARSNNASGLAVRNGLHVTGPLRATRNIESDLAIWAGTNLVADGAVIADGNIIGDTLVGNSIRPQWVAGPTTNGDWYWIGAGDSRTFNYSQIPRWWRVLYSESANYNGARNIAETSTLISRLNTSDGWRRVTNNSSAGFYFNVVGLRFG